ncbi:MAG: flavin reductase family protein [Bacteroidetes bacterium]|nr:flavin reductase family protein [Bacteroidota bacterium]
MLKIDPAHTPHQKVHQMMLGAIAPRPIAFASTMDKEGISNLSPFSFFNAFGVNPTTLIFSPSRRGRDNTTKHTYENLKQVPEVVINVVTYAMVEQTSLASTEYPRGVNEFMKSGFTPIPSETIKPFRVKESPVQFECKVRQIIETGDQGGAANLVICEIKLMHIDEAILDENGRIDLYKIDLVGRMGGDYYCRASGDSLFKVKKPLQELGIGIDSLPEKIRYSAFLTGNELGKLGNLEQLPSEAEIAEFISISRDEHNDLDVADLYARAKALLADNKVKDALTLLMAHL